VKVYIGPYPNIYSTNRWKSFWYKVLYNTTVEYISDKQQADYNKSLVGFIDSSISFILNISINAINKRRFRRINIIAHKYDAIQTHQTLALVILPVLKQLRKNSTSIFIVAPEDVPAHLKLPDDLSEFDIHANAYARWRYIIDSMIVAFEYLANNATANNNDTVDFGLRMFAKYYKGLWY
jgi:hypothetical protein